VAEDLDYSASDLRLLSSSLGVQAGVVGANDFKVAAGSGLQVNVEKGKGFIEQTKATQESSNAFYNGLYNVLNPTEQNPYNSVEVPTTNPQIAQIILRVYDINELKISGSTYARVEWLNGTANAGATKAHIEEEEASTYGAAILPQSSFRLCYVLVPKNATKSSEFEIFDKRFFNNKWPLNIVSRSSNYTAVPGEMAIIEGENICTLPVLPKGLALGAFAVISATIKTTGAFSFIFGDFVEGKKEVKLGKYQHLILQSDGEGSYIIIDGSPINENKLVKTEPTRAAVHAGIQPSKSYRALVTVFTNGGGEIDNIEVEGKVVGTLGVPGTVTFSVPAGAFWKSFSEKPSNSYIVTTLLL
jgi:hypothetical protein